MTMSKSRVGELKLELKLKRSGEDLQPITTTLLACIFIYSSTKLNHNRVSYRTVCRALNSLGLRSSSAQSRFYLGGKNGEEQQLNFCREMLQCLQERMKIALSRQVIFSDQRIIFGRNCGRDLIRKRWKQAIPKNYIRQKKKYEGGLSIIMWRAIRADDWRTFE